MVKYLFKSNVKIQSKVICTTSIITSWIMIMTVWVYTYLLRYFNLISTIEFRINCLKIRLLMCPLLFLSPWKDRILIYFYPKGSTNCTRTRHIHINILLMVLSVDDNFLGLRGKSQNHSQAAVLITDTFRVCGGQRKIGEGSTPTIGHNTQ